MIIDKKPKLKIVIGQAKHFIRWELPYLEDHFEIVEQADKNTLLYAFGPDVLSEAARLPALRRVIVLFPGYGFNPYHNLEYRREALHFIDNYFDLVFVNPGPLEKAYQSSKKVRIYPFTIDSNLIECLSYRKKIDSLLHVSNPTPQKDWKRSLEVMQRTNLTYQVFPKRNRNGDCRTVKTRIKGKVNKVMGLLNVPLKFSLSTLEQCGYVDHKVVVKQYQQFDGFVHVASEVVDQTYIDGKYTACALEAGLTGAIVFWHDTLQLGNDFKTFFNLPLEPQKAADEILLIRNNIDVEKHSKLTREEVLSRCSIAKSMDYRLQKIKELL